jgi:hypothetical protein
VDTNCDAVGDGPLDYSPGTNIALNENNLNENNGVCGAGFPVDWNCDGDGGTDVGLIRNINCQNWCTFGNCYDGIRDVLNDNNDWNRLCNTGMAIPAGTDAPVPEIISCQEVPRAFQIRN